VLPREQPGHGLQPHYCHRAADGSAPAATAGRASVLAKPCEPAAQRPRALAPAAVSTARESSTLLASPLMAGWPTCNAAPAEHASARTATHCATATHAAAPAPPAEYASTWRATPCAATAVHPTVATASVAGRATSAPNPAGHRGGWRRPSTHAGGRRREHCACERQSAHDNRLFGWWPPAGAL
jgi:hypothetical protein